MDQNFLLTYIVEERDTYAWFKTEEEMNDFIESEEGVITVTEKHEILNAREIV